LTLIFNKLYEAVKIGYTFVQNFIKLVLQFTSYRIHLVWREY